MQINPTQLRTICRTMDEPRSVVISALLNELCPKYGIDTPDKVHELIAQLAHESGEFRYKEENLRYSAEGLRKIWPARFDGSTSQKYQGKPEAIANKVYAGRMGNGDEGTGDGWRFRGGGFIQLTGRDIYTKFARFKGVDVGTIADQVRTSDAWALDSALWFFCIEKQLLDEAERDEFIKITRAINGGTIGLQDRQKYYERAKAAIK